jgi:hypothetical protein
MHFRLFLLLLLTTATQTAWASKYCILITDRFFETHRQVVAIETVPKNLLPSSATPFTHSTNDLYRLALLDNLARALSDRDHLQLDQWLVGQLQNEQHIVVPVRRKGTEFIEVWAEQARIQYRFFRLQHGLRVYTEGGAIDSHTHSAWHRGLMTEARAFDLGEALLTEFVHIGSTQAKEPQLLARAVLKNLDASQLLTRWGYFERYGFRNLMVELANKVKPGQLVADQERLLRVTWVDDGFLKITDAREALSFLIPKSEIFGNQSRMNVYVLMRESDETLHRVMKLNADGPLGLETAGFDPWIGVDLYRPVAKMPQRLLKMLGR